MLVNVHPQIHIVSLNGMKSKVNTPDYPSRDEITLGFRRFVASILHLSYLHATNATRLFP
jgi:hypothetical protein